MEEYKLFGGSEGNRTLYLLNANQALSQVSYRPMLLKQHLIHYQFYSCYSRILYFLNSN